MKVPTPPTPLERVAGSRATEVALTSAAAAVGGVLAPLVPVLTKSLAASRQQQRIDAALQDISGILQAHERAIEQLSDPQYKLINEIVLAVLHTTENDKLTYLKRSLKIALYATDLKAHEAIVLSRMVRDISAAEAAFLLKAFTRARVLVVEEGEAEVAPNDLRVLRTSPEGLCASGLFSLGILMPTNDLYGGGTAFSFSSITAKLIALFAAT